ncbi:MAG TPA: hypothetical protein VGC76_08420, partial [Pyrinomonadaceae bacterium]
MKSVNIYSFISSRKSICFILLCLLAIVLMWRSGEILAQKDAGETLTSGKFVDSKAFSEFDEWIKLYLDGNFAGEREFIKSGEEIARKRRELFKELIRTNPEKAIKTSVSKEIQNRLPVEITQFLEKEISARGDFNVYAIDEFDSANHQTEREFVVGDSRYEAFVYGRKESMTTKLDIALRGIVLDRSMAVDENSIRKLSPSELAARNIKADKFGENRIVAEVGGNLIYFADERKFEDFVQESINRETKISPLRSEISPWTEGAKTLLFIRIDFPDRPGEPTDRFHQPLTEGLAQNLIDNTVNQFYIDNSYQKTSLRATVTPVVRMPQPQTAYPRENLIGLITDARNAARAAGFETNNYNLDLVAFSYSDMYTFSGISPIANKGALLNGSFTFKTVTHELGHEYGLMHANLWRTSDGTIIGEGANVEYGDDFDMMGRGATQETHFNASYKRTLDWLTEENVQTVAQNGVYRVFAFDSSAAQPQGIRALKIKKDPTKDYWIEFRQQITSVPSLLDGALIRWDSPFEGYRRTQLLDMNPATTSLTDASLLIGQSFSDDASGIKITVLGKGGTTPESLDIKVEFNYSIINGARFDFDGDAKTDVSIFRPTVGEWWYLRSSDNQNH